jgi:Flp pilus assembly protein TadG
VTRPASSRERGTVTVEVAIALPALAVLLAALLGIGVAVTSHVRCAEAARAGARQAALGTSDSSVSDAVRRVGGSLAIASVTRGDGIVTVTVVMPVQIGGLFASMSTDIRASAHANCEPHRGCG